MRALQLIILILVSSSRLFAQSTDRELRGQLLNADGQPVPNASIRVRAVSRTAGTRYGDTDDVEVTTKTGAKGDFIIRAKNPFLAATITAEAAHYAKGVFTELATGGQVHTLTMLEGVTLTGVVKKDGDPLANVKLGLCDTDRGSRIFTIDLNATTDAQGQFRIEHLAPKRDYFLFGFMHSFADKGALPSRRITAGADASHLDLGELKVEPAYILEGRLSIQLPHIPILLSRYRGRDAQTAETGALGQFHFAGVPGEVVIISIDGAGQHPSLNNASINPVDPTHLVGRILTNKTDLLIDMEQGPPLEPLNISAIAAAEEPLRGAEPPSASPNTFKVSGAVTDADTGQKLPSIITSEGRMNNRAYDWFFTRKQRHPSGDITTFLNAGETPPVLIVQAENHLPWVSGPITTATNLTIKLKKGIEAKGVVLKPDGQPASNITVYLASPYGHTRIENFGVENTAAKSKTDSKGQFSFPPQTDAVAVMIFDSAGFAETSIEELQKTGQIHLQALSKVEGRLLIGAAPGPNEVIYLSTAPVPYHWYPLELPAYSITLTTRTDTSGNFAFDRVPPTFLEIAHSPTVAIETSKGSLPSAAPAGAFRLTQTQRLRPKPGETLRVTLGGQGRTMTGRLELAGYDAPIDWRGSPVTMENIVTHYGPSDAAMKSLTEKLRQTQRPGSAKAERDAAEADYNAERRAFATATRKYFSTDEGAAALTARHRYFPQIDSEGNIRINDVPPGKYRITGWLANPDPSAFAASRRIIAPVDLELTVPEGSGPFDCGSLKIPLPKSPRR